MDINKMTKEELMFAILDNDITDITKLSDDITKEELITIVHQWITEGDETEQ